VNFLDIPSAEKTVRVRTEWASSLKEALLDGLRGASTDLGGRGGVLRFVFEGGAGVLRKYRRGGLARLLAKDAYLLDNRPSRELELLTRMHEGGLPVPEPLGACWEQRFGWVRGAIATRALDAVTLVEFLENQPAKSPAVLHRVGAVIRRMHDFSVFHADLQARNILVNESEAFVIDFDNAQRFPRLTSHRRARNLLRLRRSLRKNRLPDTVFEAILTGYGTFTLPPWLDRFYDYKEKVSDVLYDLGQRRTHDPQPR
jgi:3-deoxy-D-manno-octulosonic acid kinase